MSFLAKSSRGLCADSFRRWHSFVHGINWVVQGDVHARTSTKTQAVWCGRSCFLSGLEPGISSLFVRFICSSSLCCQHSTLTPACCSYSSSVHVGLDLFSFYHFWAPFRTTIHRQPWIMFVFVDPGDTQLRPEDLPWCAMVWPVSVRKEFKDTTQKNYARTARGSFCHISEQANQFNKYLLSIYSVQGMVCILKRKMVWPWGGGENKNMVQPICKCLRDYWEQGKLHKVLVQSDYLYLFQ